MSKSSPPGLLPYLIMQTRERTLDYSRQATSSSISIADAADPEEPRASIVCSVGIPRRRWQYALKRCVDFSLAGAGIAILLPVLIAVAALIRLTMGTPVLFRQLRPGKSGLPFTVLKFRTMSDQRNDEGCLLEDELRLTRLGKFLRRTSVDELPQLLNVLKGDLSLVGPRPLLMKYLPLYSARQARRHEVMPGITGWAQISGRNQLNWPEKLEMDVWYVENWSIWLDLKILLLTLTAVTRADGINQDGCATMSEFLGSNKDS